MMACNLNKNNLPHGYFSEILVRFRVLLNDISKSQKELFQRTGNDGFP